MRYVVALLLSGIIYCVPVSAFDVGERFLDYGNGLINLDQVTHVIPEIEYTVTLPEDSVDEFFEVYLSSLNEEAIRDVLGWFDYRSMQEVPFYYLKIRGNIKFDDFTLEMMDEQIFIKLPEDETLSYTSTAYGEKFEEFVIGVFRKHVTGGLLSLVGSDAQKKYVLVTLRYSIIREVWKAWS